MIRIPPYLKKGDTVVLVAPARSVSEAEVEMFAKWVKLQGWKLEFSPNLFCVENQFAGSDNQRAEDLIWAFSHPLAKAIFTARGGYGSIRALDSLRMAVDKEWLNHQIPKWFIGFSDVTTLHLWLQKNGWASIHGPVATQCNLQNDWVAFNWQRLATVLRGEAIGVEIDIENSINGKSFNGQIIGGNLSLIYASLGTDLQPDTLGKILLIEDLDEYLYHIDRMLLACKNAGLFDGIAALLVGSMIEMKDNAVPFGKTVKEMILEILKDVEFPILFDVNIGHDEQNNAVKLGCDCNFDNSKLIQ